MTPRLGGTLLGRALRRLKAEPIGGGVSPEDASAVSPRAAVDPEELAGLRRELLHELDRLAGRTPGEGAPARR